jgi:hypothetical protein
MEILKGKLRDQDFWNTFLKLEISRLWLRGQHNNYEQIPPVKYCTPPYHQDTGWLILTVSLWVVEVYQICTAYF